MAKAKRKEKKLRPMTTTELETLLRSSFATLTQDLNCIGGTASAANRKATHIEIDKLPILYKDLQFANNALHDLDKRFTKVQDRTEEARATAQAALDAICPRVAARLTALERESARTMAWKDSVVKKVDAMLTLLNSHEDERVSAEIAINCPQDNSGLHPHLRRMFTRPNLELVNTRALARKLFERKYAKDPSKSLYHGDWSKTNGSTKLYWYDQAEDLVKLVDSCK